jgi:hypothetical protein
MDNLQIEIFIKNGEKTVQSSISLETYQMVKEMHGVSLADEQISVLLNEIKPNITNE